MFYIFRQFIIVNTFFPAVSNKSLHGKYLNN